MKGTTYQINQPLTIIGDSTLRDIDVWSPDTDALILLVDLVTHGRLGAFTTLNFLTGKGDKYRSIKVRECHWAREVSRSDWFPSLHRLQIKERNLLAAQRRFG